MKRVYVAGPMTGLPEFNFPAFHAATATLRARGLDVINPAEFTPDLDNVPAWEDCMRRDIAALVTCDSVVLLPGWEASRGATLEHLIATKLGMQVQLLEDLRA